MPSLSVGQSQFFSPQELASINREKKVPLHVAITMDGNRRWARKLNRDPISGHWEGAERLTEIVKAASELGIQVVTVYAFSTENWSRSHKEVEALINLFEFYLESKRDLLRREGVRLEAIGDLLRLPPRVQEALNRTREVTRDGKRITLVMALNYGGRDEIRRAIKSILSSHDARKIAPEELTEDFIAKYLDTAAWGDPDLFIRTGGELRVSNFLLWQISYAEFYVTETLWPDFSPKELLRAVLAYQSRQQRLGR